VKGERFIAEVKNLAEIDNDEQARKAIGATLETLRERLAGNEPADLAAQLPPEIAPSSKEPEGESPSPRKSSTSGWQRRRASRARRPSVTPGRWPRWCKRP
jgi:uncharacterized protein (DUF2267 family)